MANRVLTAVCAALALTLTTACESQGDVDNPVVRRATWFSFINGDDLRPACGEGAVDQVRLVYNGDYRRQVRIYQLFADPQSGRGRLTVRAAGKPNLLGEIPGLQVENDWRGEKESVDLDPGQTAALLDALDRSGLKEAPPVGERLPSNHYFWSAVGCRDGKWVFNVWHYPSQNFHRQTFAALLLSFDHLSLPYEPPKPVEYVPQKYRAREIHFTLEVGQDGFLTAGPLFGRPAPEQPESPLVRPPQ